MALPTTNLTLHCDASDTGQLFTTYVASGVHTGTPVDASAVQVWDDEGDGIADVALVYYPTAGDSPNYRATTPLMALPCLDFDGTSDRLRVYDQTGITAKAASTLITTTAYTVLVAFYAESIATTNAAVYDNAAIIADIDGYFGLFTKDESGTKKLYAYNWDGNADSVGITVLENTSYVAMMRHESGTLYLSINGGSESSVVSGTTSSLAGIAEIGHGATNYFNGRVGEFAIWNAALTGSNLSDAISYFTTKWIGGAPATRIKDMIGFDIMPKKR